MDSTKQCKHINPVARIIQNEIAASGVISFARFMELALYHPEHGYYRQSRTGKRGDFFTSVSVGPLFGQMLAFFLAQKMDNIPGDIQLVEAGANDGSLARDILAWLEQNRPEIATRLTYCVIEPFPQLQQRQRESLPLFRSNWFHSLAELPPIRGAFISNELLDAFPIHIFQWRSKGQDWIELGVDEDLQWTPLPFLPNWFSERLAEMEIDQLQAHLPDRFTVEFSPASEQWWGAAASKLQTGLMLAIDYGDEALGFWSPSRVRGTSRAYRNHKLVENSLADPGEQDITASVNFTRIRTAGELAGLVSTPLQTQAEFLTRIAADFFSNHSPNDTRQFQTLTHPEQLGERFKVLIQSRINS